MSSFCVHRGHSSLSKAPTLQSRVALGSPFTRACSSRVPLPCMRCVALVVCSCSPPRRPPCRVRYLIILASGGACVLCVCPHSHSIVHAPCRAPWIAVASRMLLTAPRHAPPRRRARRSCGVSYRTIYATWRMRDGRRESRPESIYNAPKNITGSVMLMVYVPVASHQSSKLYAILYSFIFIY